jgi:hypothetical protein
MPLESTKHGAYMPTGSGGLRKGDTIYVRPTFDVGDLGDRDMAIHELEHARQDKAETTKVVKSGAELEPDAYVAGSRYLLEEIAAMPEKKRPDVIKKVAADWADFDMYAAVIAAKASPDTLMPVLKAINAARKKDSQFDDFVLKKPDNELRELIVDRLGSSARTRTTLSGFSGESEFDLRRGAK